MLLQSLKRLSQVVASVSGQQLDERRLAQSARQYASAYATLERLEHIRARSPERIPAYELFLLKAAGFYLPIDIYNAALDAYLRCVEGQHVEHNKDKARVLLAGCCCEEPPADFVRVIEQAACYVVWDDIAGGWGSRNARRLERVNGLESYADWLLGLLAKDPVRYRHARGRSEALIRLVQRTRADGVILCFPRFCDPIQLRLPAITEALEANSVPYCCVSFASDWSELATLRDQVQAFADRLRLWSKR